MEQAKVLLVEDDPAIAELIGLHLVDSGFTLEHHTDGANGLNRALSGEHSLVILDLNLPGLAGMEVCKRLRQQNVHVPILMLTSRSDELDKVLGLEMGADDYLTKPFSVRELTARCRALVRRSEIAQAPQPNGTNGDEGMVFPGLRIDTTKRRVYRDSALIDLTPTEYSLLVFLASNPGRPYTKEQLIKNVWGYDTSGYEATVSSHVSRLRTKIEPDAAEPTYVKTAWGVGYYFTDGDEA